MKTQTYCQYTWFRVADVILLSDVETGKDYLYRPINGCSFVTEPCMKQGEIADAITDQEQSAMGFTIFQSGKNLLD